MNFENQTLTYYNQKAKEFVSGTVDVAFTEIQDMFLQYVPAGGNILDFGCGSEELCCIASEYSGITVKHMLFEELDEVEKYDGIWACASILHVEKKQLPDILKKIAVATKNGGVVYTSFKYGDSEGMRNGRYFTYLKEDSFREMLDTVPELTIEKLWVSADVRADRGEEQWLNLILRKQALV